jgi:hypothetical protein
LDPPSKIFTKLVIKNAINPKNGVLFPKISTTPTYPSPKKLVKTSWTLSMDFETVCIYVQNITISEILTLSLKNVH